MFLSILAYLIVAIIFLGANSINNWTPSPLTTLGAEQVVDIVLITILSAYVAWVINADMKVTLKRLGLENDKATASQQTIQLLLEQEPLTGLLNRNACEDYYQKLLAQIKDKDELITLLFIDLDNFKNINDSFGHNAGDELLIAISNEFKKLLLPTDVACRLGGDEFVLIIKRDKQFDINKFATSVMQVIATPYYVFETSIRMTGSVGIAIAPIDGREFDEMRKKADIAMYESKQLGKNTFSYYSKELHEEALRKTSILTGLKDAIEQESFDLHFQPKVNLSNGKVESAEALLRWSRDNPSGFMPDEFIPILESTELIHEIGKWVIDEACRVCKKWHDAGFDQLCISVNVSSVQFMRNSFKTHVFNALKKYDLAPEFLEIELTEHVLIQHNATITAQLKSLKDLGIQLSIDDFVTGYSNLSYLINFKVDTIKLDKSFILELNTSKNHFAVVKAVIQMAHILNLNVVAEGVETTAVRNILVNLKCDFAQGYLWSKAVPEKQFIDSLESFNKVLTVS
ncbi:putative bifunctional diguanylate cyclase/phosphodiesterase [Leucothrix arctica]|nr:GGDEF domain-containing phosphodiesterase [Leucothrix arctica]